MYLEAYNTEDIIENLLKTMLKRVQKDSILYACKQ